MRNVFKREAYAVMIIYFWS